MSTFDVRNESDEPITRVSFCNSEDDGTYLDAFTQFTADLCIQGSYISLTANDLQNLKRACDKSIELINAKKGEK